ACGLFADEAAPRPCVGGPGQMHLRLHGVAAPLSSEHSHPQRENTETPAISVRADVPLTLFGKTDRELPTCRFESGAALDRQPAVLKEAQWASARLCASAEAG